MKYYVQVDCLEFEIYEIEARSKRDAERLAEQAINDGTLLSTYPQVDYSDECVRKVDKGHTVAELL